MVRCRTAASSLLAIALCAVGGPAAAQTPEAAPAYASPAGRRLSFGGELTGVIGPKDDTAFFNYTDYEHNALRVGRVRLLGEWRATDTISFLGEVRTEDVDVIELPALYIRWQPWRAHAFTVQAGRIPPVFGLFARQAYGRDNPVIGAPLAYQYLADLRPDALPSTADDVLRMRGRGWEPSYPIGDQTLGPGVPLISAFRWDTGVEASWQDQRFDLNGAVTLGAPAAPSVTTSKGGPGVSGRIAWHVVPSFTVGASGARGNWIDTAATDLIPAPLRSPVTQTAYGGDAQWGLGHWLVHAEIVRSDFEVPIAFDPQPRRLLSAHSEYADVRYRLHPRWDISARVDRLDFSDVIGELVNGGRPEPWDAGVRRVEGVVSYRVTRQFESRVGWQQNWRDGGRVSRRGYPALELLYWF